MQFRRISNQQHSILNKLVAVSNSVHVVKVQIINLEHIICLHVANKISIFVQLKILFILDLDFVLELRAPIHEGVDKALLHDSASGCHVQRV